MNLKTDSYHAFVQTSKFVAYFLAQKKEEIISKNIFVLIRSKNKERRERNGRSKPTNPQLFSFCTKGIG